MKNIINRTFAAVLVCLAANIANAGPVQIREASLAQGLWSNALVLPVQSTTANYWTGLQTIVLDNARQLLAFCVDPWEWSPSSNQPYAESSNFTAYFGDRKAALIRELYADAYAGTQLPATSGGNLNAAAFQLALWEIITDSNRDLATGGVRTLAATNPQIVRAAEALLDQLGDGSNSNDNYAFTLYTSGKSMGLGRAAGFQDYLVVQRISEPTSGALLLAALAIGTGFGLGRRRPAIASRV